MPGFFSNTLAVLRREIYRVARQPMYWLLTVILPIVAFAFFAVLLYKGVARDIPIAVVDQDNITLSRKVTQMIDATPTAWVAYGVQGMEEAERLMLQGKVMGIVLIPDFFEKNILNNSQTHLESYLTGTNITVNGLLAKDLQTTVTTFTAGIQLQLLMKQGLTETGYGATDARTVRQTCAIQPAYQLRLLPFAEFYADDASDLHDHGDDFRHRNRTQERHPGSGTTRPEARSSRPTRAKSCRLRSLCS